MITKIISNLWILFIITGMIWQIFLFFLGRKKHAKPVNREKRKYHYCILIPARDESTVIEDLLKSIQNQTKQISFKDVYIIVESDKDKTVEIAEKYEANIFVRKRLELQRKGYALDECIKSILDQGKSYDAYFIFDADDILDKNFIEKMDQSYQAGYMACTGYRDVKNGNDNVISACSALTFTMINTIGNRYKNSHNQNITLSGTGYFIAKELIEEWSGFPFHTLTEDYQQSLYLLIEGYSTHYNEEAIFYDEQPTDMHTSIQQRIRWIRGYLDSRRMYHNMMKEKIGKDILKKYYLIPKYFGIKPLLLIIIGIVLGVFTQMNLTSTLKNGILIFLVVYLLLFLVTVFMIYLEKGRISISREMKIKAFFFNPLFLASYLYCAVVAITRKTIVWTKIEHNKH